MRVFLDGTLFVLGKELMAIVAIVFHGVRIGFSPVSQKRAIITFTMFKMLETTVHFLRIGIAFLELTQPFIKTNS